MKKIILLSSILSTVLLANSGIELKTMGILHMDMYLLKVKYKMIKINL